jgi:hypothetical protein
VSNDKEIIARRTGVALAAIRQLLDEDESAVSLFASHHLEQMDSAYWSKHAGTPRPTVRQVVDLLELRSHWGDDDEDGIDVFDFTLPDEATQYIIAVRFGKDGEIEEISMES